MMIFIDTNVVLDVALDRARLAETSRAVLTWAFNHPGSACIAWHSAATLAYFLSKQAGGNQARAFLGELAARIEVQGGSERDLLRAVELPLADLEDAMIAALAESSSATYIVTRNLSDFKKSPVKAISPEDFIRLAAKG